MWQCEVVTTLQNDAAKTFHVNIVPKNQVNTVILSEYKWLLLLIKSSPKPYKLTFSLVY